MGSLFGGLVKLIKYAFSGGGKWVLASLGIGLFTSGVMLTVLNEFVQMAIDSLPALGQDAMALMGLLGLDKALSIIIGAYVVKFTMKSTGVTAKAVSKT